MLETDARERAAAVRATTGGFFRAGSEEGLALARVTVCLGAGRLLFA